MIPTKLLLIAALAFFIGCISGQIAHHREVSRTPEKVIPLVVE